MNNVTATPEDEQVSGPWVGYEAAAKHTDLSETYLRQLVMRGEIPSRKIGRRVLFSLPTLDRWVANNGAMSSDDAASQQAAS